MVNKGLEEIIKMLEIAHTDAAVFPSTDLYNEGWMLRILLSIQSEGVECFPFTFQPGARWFSEARIDSPFLPRSPRDPLAETHTQILMNFLMITLRPSRPMSSDLILGSLGQGLYCALQENVL